VLRRGSEYRERIGPEGTWLLGVAWCKVAEDGHVRLNLIETMVGKLYAKLRDWISSLRDAGLGSLLYNVGKPEELGLPFAFHGVPINTDILAIVDPAPLPILIL
jgi:hypothetical protein